MERTLLPMDNLTRLFPHPLPLYYVGYLPRDKAADKEVVYPTLDFYLILSSGGGGSTSEVDGVRHVASIPCLGINIPGRTYRHLGAKMERELLFFAYDKSLMANFGGLNISLEPALRPIVLTPPLTAQINRLFELMRNAHDHGNPDRIDRLAESIIVESLLSAVDGGRMGAAEKAVRKIASEIEIGYSGGLDLSQLLDKHKISMRTFTRHWRQFQPLPPNKYITKLRIEEAKRLLDSYKSRINDVARQVGFDDPYYFMRKFRRLVGMSPKEYRDRGEGSKA